MTDPALRAAYRSARYRIDCGTQWIERRIGRIDASADAALTAAGCRSHWHVLTPCNPRSRRLSDADNASRVAALRTELTRYGWIALPALNTDEEGRWQEPGFCILDAPQTRVVELAAYYGQLAIVAGTPGAAPTLLWIGTSA
ncbi:DUF3293 domain-containing protein [Fontimonas sp. SYSU GA230001]|uniref:DUF3293 domain-containing protein n=1 Tax=Fontimonas sp. SYSU GA230001 TaxID=3142450 RepID=UPI0032B319AE